MCDIICFRKLPKHWWKCCNQKKNHLNPDNHICHIFFLITWASFCWTKIVKIFHLFSSNVAKSCSKKLHVKSKKIHNNIYGNNYMESEWFGSCWSCKKRCKNFPYSLLIRYVDVVRDQNNYIIYYQEPSSWSSSNTFAYGAGGLRFKFRASLIEHSVANGSPLLQHFFEKSCVSGAKWCWDGPPHTRYVLWRHTASIMKDLIYYHEHTFLPMNPLMYFCHIVSKIIVGMDISEYRIQKDPNPKLSGIQIEI